MRASQTNLHPGYKLKYPICVSCYFKNSEFKMQSQNIKRFVRSMKNSFIIKGICSPCVLCGKLTNTKCSACFYINSRKEGSSFLYGANFIEVLDFN